MSNNSKTIDTLVSDIEEVLTKGVKLEDKDIDLSTLEQMIKYRLSPESKIPDKKGLRMSNAGSPCLRKIWYGKHTPEDAEAMDANTQLKFMYGDILEWLMLVLAKVAGHKVEGEQDDLKIGEVEGHRDAIIDGVVVDVKTASKFGFIKFKQNAVDKDDPFGYMTQLNLYHHASDGVDPSRMAFLAVEKESGKFVLDTYKPKEGVDWETELRKKKELVDADTPPDRAFKAQPYGAGGNMALGTVCSYCPFKHKCWPGLRTFLYSGNKPVFMTQVLKEPNVYEVKDRNAQVQKET